MVDHLPLPLFSVILSLQIVVVVTLVLLDDESVNIFHLLDLLILLTIVEFYHLLEVVV
jgi:hypothetical protein